MSFLDIFKPKWKHSDPKVRKDAVSKMANLALLEKIASEDMDSSVRKEASDAIKACKASSLGVSLSQYDVILRLIPIHDRATMENGPMHTHIHYDFSAASKAYCAATGESRADRMDIVNRFICKDCGKGVMAFDVSRSTNHYTIARCGKCHSTFLYKAH